MYGRNIVSSGKEVVASESSMYNFQQSKGLVRRQACSQKAPQGLFFEAAIQNCVPNQVSYYSRANEKC